MNRNKKNHNVEKAYKNLDFLTSPDARVVRILSEFIKPAARFKKYHIEDTIVFFGSARITDRATAKRKLKELEDAGENDQQEDNFETLPH